MSLRRALLLTFLLASANATAFPEAARQTCVWTLDPAGLSALLNNGKITYELSVESVKPREDSPGHFVITRKAEMPWTSKFEPELRLLAGDPRWFLRIFRDLLPTVFFEIYQYFEFEFLSKTELSVSSPERFAELVEALRLPGAPRFRRADGIYSPGTMVMDFALELMIPLAAPPGAGEEHLFVPFLHDLAYHAAAILIPQEVLAHSQYQTRYLLQFVNVLRARAQLESEPLEGLDELLNRWIIGQAIAIDSGAGNFVSEAGGGLVRSATYYLSQTLLRRGESPREMLRLLVTGSDIKSARTAQWVQTQFEAFARGIRAESFQTGFSGTASLHAAIQLRAIEILERIRVINQRNAR